MRLAPAKKAGASDDSWAVHVFLVAAYAHEGEVAKAEAAKAALLRRPGLSIADIKAAGYSNEPAFLEQLETHTFAGLRKAGIPETLIRQRPVIQLGSGSYRDALLKRRRPRISGRTWV